MLRNSRVRSTGFGIGRTMDRRRGSEMIKGAGAVDKGGGTALEGVDFFFFFPFGKGGNFSLEFFGEGGVACIGASELLETKPRGLDRFIAIFWGGGGIWALGHTQYCRFPTSRIVGRPRGDVGGGGGLSKKNLGLGNTIPLPPPAGKFRPSGSVSLPAVDAGRGFREAVCNHIKKEWLNGKITHVMPPLKI